MSWLIGVDVGGTFTDFFAFDQEAGAVHLHKTASTPANPAQAIFDGLASMRDQYGIDLFNIRRLAHGTTTATNALIQRQGTSPVLIVTKGFKDLIEIGRQIRPKIFDLQADYPTPLVAREHRIEVKERITAAGRVLCPLRSEEIERVVEQVRAIGPRSVAICLLFSFAEPRHELALAERLVQALPEIKLSVSCEVQSEFREYERLSTTVLNAYLLPVIERYLQLLAEGVRELSPAAAIGINQSSGGLMSIERARQFPVRTALSGPAAGVVGAIEMARLSNCPNIITLDMGGTSADLSLIRDYKMEVSYSRWIEGYPVRLAAVDIAAIGAGGGSIAWFDRDGLMKVGPQSAGADPGPVCYCRGGTEPTVTDANLLLGRLSPDGLLDGAMRLDHEAAARALRPFAERLGLTLERTAIGIIGIVVANMVRAIRSVSIERGHDPRQFTLLAFGGAGPLHARDVAVSLGMRRMLVPAAPGILCAQGLIVSDLRESFVRTAVLRLDPKLESRLEGLVTGLRVQAEAWFAAESISRSDRHLDLAFDMRYVGQNFELAVPVDAGPDLTALPHWERLRALFLLEHERSYGYFNPDDAVEIINARLTAVGRQRRPALVSTARATAPPRPAGHRLVWYNGQQPTTTPIFRRDALAPGHTITGPAVIEQLDATTLLNVGDIAAIDHSLNIIVEITP